MPIIRGNVVLDYSHQRVNKYGIRCTSDIYFNRFTNINCNRNDNAQGTMKISNDKITRDARIPREKNLHSNIPCDCLLRDKKPVQKITIRNQWIYTILRRKSHRTWQKTISRLSRVHLSRKKSIDIHKYEKLSNDILCLFVPNDTTDRSIFNELLRCRFIYIDKNMQLYVCHPIPNMIK